MAGIRLEGNTSGRVAEVNANQELQVNLAMEQVSAGFATALSDVDDGTVTGSRLARALEAEDDYRLRVGIDNPFFTEFFTGAALNSAIWTAPVTTQTVTVSGGFCNLNAGASIAASGVSRLQSYRSFPLQQTGTTYLEAAVQFTALPVTNTVCEWGFAFASAIAQPTDGAFFRYFADGTFRGVVNNNGAEMQTGALNAATLVGINTVHHFIVGVADDMVEFWIDDVLVGTVARPPAVGTNVASPYQQIMFRNYVNASGASTAQIMKIGMVGVSVASIGLQRSWADVCTGMGNSAYQGPTSGTMGSTAYAPNSANPTAGVPSNTAALANTGLGGQFWTTQTLAVGTDGIVSSYQNPAAAVGTPGHNLLIYGVTIDSTVQTVLAGGPFILQWGLAWGHTAVSLATTETATTKAPRRKNIGFQNFAATAAVGSQGLVLKVTFSQPIVVQPGEFFQTLYKNIGTLGTSGTIAHCIDVDAKWE